MPTKANVALFPPGPTIVNGVLHLPSEESKSVLMTPLGYLALSLIEALSALLISNTSNSHYHQDFEQLQLLHMLPAVGGSLYCVLLFTL